MKKLNFKNISFASLLALSFSFASCSLTGLDLQEDYDYQKKTLDPHINKTARQFLEERSYTPAKASDTVFKWMRLGLDYAGISLDEYEKSGRTFIFLHNDAIRVWDSSKKVATAGFWFDFPIIDTVAGVQPRQYVKNADGSLKTHPAKSWSEYSKETVRNYFLYLIAEGDYGFNNAVSGNTALKTLLPANATATAESKLGYYEAGTEALPAGIVSRLNWSGANGFDPEGKMNMRLVNNQNSPLRINDKTDDRSAGHIATNGQVHVFGATVYPFRY